MTAPLLAPVTRGVVSTQRTFAQGVVVMMVVRFLVLTGVLAGLSLASSSCSGTSGSDGGTGGGGTSATGGGTNATGGGTSATGGGSSASGGGTNATGGGSGATGGGTTATGGGSSAAGGGTTATGGGTSATGGGTATSDGGTFYSIKNTDCFDFRTATVNGTSCDMQGEGDGSLTTNLPAPPGTNGLGNLCDLNNNGTSNPDSYTSLAAVPSSCAGHSWTNYIEGGGGSLSNYGILVAGGEAAADGGIAEYRVWVANSSSSSSVYQINFQFSPL